MNEHLRTCIENALSLNDPELTVRCIQRDLSVMIRSGSICLDPRFLKPKKNSYARRLLFRDRIAGYSVVVMTWSAGQNTPLHDHAGIWCVEGVLQGEISVFRYELLRRDGDLFHFSSEPPFCAGIGSTGNLIPPHEHHVLGNAGDAIAITLHVYGGEMDHCNVYVPRSDTAYERVSHTLGFDD